MKMVKSLLLGSAAGLVAVAGAQAADLPVKAAPVEYVKVCSLYGVGYYYMPGTDICVKIGGYIRFQTTFGTSNPTFPLAGQNLGRGAINDAPYGFRTRGVLTVDTRQQTAYGTLRTYLLLGFQQTNNGQSGNSPPLYATRGFIQWAGFTFGKATSFFDHFPTAGRNYFSGNFHNSSTGDAGHTVAAYTAQFGNGFSATISLEEPRSRATILAAGGLPAANPYYGGQGEYPDVVANLRIDQAWGSAMIGGALHDASVTAAAAGGGAVPLGIDFPSRMGWALTAATQINLPMISPGSTFNAQFIYARGATSYASNTSGTAYGSLPAVRTDGGAGISYALFADAVAYGVPGGVAVDLSTAWSLALAYEHVWRPGLKTSIYGSYLDVSYTGGANAGVCAALVGPGGLVCDSDWSAWNVGSRTEWAPVRGLTLGVDVIYNKWDSARYVSAAGVPYGPVGAVTEDRDSFAGMFRIQRNYHP